MATMPTQPGKHVPVDKIPDHVLANLPGFIDALPPAITGITSPGSKGSYGYGDVIFIHGSYGYGDVIFIHVAFSEKVLVNGTPTLALSNGGTATYTGGSGTGTLTFSYAVGEGIGQFTQNLKVTGLTGTITDQAGNAMRAFSVPTGSNLADEGDITVLNVIRTADATLFVSTNDGAQIIGTSTEIRQSLNGGGGDDLIVLPVLGGSSYGGGGADTFIGGKNSEVNIFYGDTAYMSGDIGGADVIVGRDNSPTTAFGDAWQMQSGATGGADTFMGGNDTYNSIRGDAETMYHGTTGGDDLIIGGDRSFNFLVGDARTMIYAKGGSDTIIGGAYATENLLYGDAMGMGGDGTASGARGGDDRLISGIGAVDQMYGDAVRMNGAVGGADTFVFAGQFGNDIVHDFRTADGDQLEIDVADPAAPSGEVSWEVSGSDTIIMVSGGPSQGTITLVGYTGSLDGYFIFM